MNVFFWIMRALPLIEALMRIVEMATGPKTGRLKKELVIKFVKLLLERTGHYPGPETWAEIENLLSGLIDNIADMLFNIENQEGTAER